MGRERYHTTNTCCHCAKAAVYKKRGKVCEAPPTVQAIINERNWKALCGDPEPATHTIDVTFHLPADGSDLL